MNNSREACDFKYFLLGSSRDRAIAEWAWSHAHSFFMAAGRPGPWPFEELGTLNRAHVLAVVRRIFGEDTSCVFVQSDDGTAVARLAQSSMAEIMQAATRQVAADLGPGITFDRLEIMVGRYLAEPLASRNDLGPEHHLLAATNLKAVLSVALGLALLGRREQATAYFDLANLWWHVRPLGDTWSRRKDNSYCLAIMTR